MARSREDDWAEARRRCRLSKEELRMAQAMGMNPRKLIKNIPSPSQRWKAPVGEWVPELYRERYGHPHSRRPQPSSACPPREERDQDDFREGAGGDESWIEPASDDESWAEPALSLEEEAADEDRLLLRRQEELRAAADYVAAAFARLPVVERVALIGSVAQPLVREVPLLGETGIGVAHHQVDVFLLEPGSDRYRGRLCHFGTCPKGKPECRVPGCGSALFLRQHEEFVFHARSLDPARSTLLYDRARAFGPPSLDRWEDDVPF